MKHRSACIPSGSLHDLPCSASEPENPGARLGLSNSAAKQNEVQRPAEVRYRTQQGRTCSMHSKAEARRSSVALPG